MNCAVFIFYFWKYMDFSFLKNFAASRRFYSLKIFAASRRFFLAKSVFSIVVTEISLRAARMTEITLRARAARKFLRFRLCFSKSVTIFGIVLYYNTRQTPAQSYSSVRKPPDSWENPYISRKIPGFFLGAPRIPGKIQVNTWRRKNTVLLQALLPYPASGPGERGASTITE